MKAHNNTTDIQEVITRLANARPDVIVRRLSVSHPGIDDDGLWFFRIEGKSVEVQLESSSGDCPFLVETNADAIRRDAKTVGEALSILVELLGPPSQQGQSGRG